LVILATLLRDNILFGAPLRPDLYKKAGGGDTLQPQNINWFPYVIPRPREFSFSNVGKSRVRDNLNPGKRTFLSRNEQKPFSSLPVGVSCVF
jgi:hypothetical protein